MYRTFNMGIGMMLVVSPEDEFRRYGSAFRHQRRKPATRSAPLFPAIRP